MKGCDIVKHDELQALRAVASAAQALEDCLDGGFEPYERRAELRVRLARLEALQGSED